MSACATCDGALYRGKPMAVVGGGDTAIEEALFLTRFATKVTLIHRRDELRASKIMQERARANPKIEFVWNAAVEEVLGDEFVTGVRVRDVKTDEVREPADRGPVRGDRPPAEHVARARPARARSGRLHPGRAAAPRAPRVEGVFACGDAMDPVYRQAVTAAGTGCMAAIDAERWLAEHGIG